MFAALEAVKGKMIGSLQRRHRAVEFRKFLTTLVKEVPAELDVHLNLDNCVTHKTPAIKKWLLAHRRVHLRFTPTSSSWQNLVEPRFTELTHKKLKRGVHRSVQALERDIRNWLADWDEHPRLFVWAKTADEILDKVATYRRRISGSGHWADSHLLAHERGPALLDEWLEELAKDPGYDQDPPGLQSVNMVLCKIHTLTQVPPTPLLTTWRGRQGPGSRQVFF